MSKNTCHNVIPPELVPWVPATSSPAESQRSRHLMCSHSSQKTDPPSASAQTLLGCSPAIGRAQQCGDGALGVLGRVCQHWAGTDPTARSPGAMPAQAGPKDSLPHQQFLQCLGSSLFTLNPRHFC